MVVEDPTSVDYQDNERSVAEQEQPRSAYPAPSQAVPDSNPEGYTRLDFAVAVLGELNAPTTQENLRALVAWMERENTRAQFNPFATTKAGFGSTSTINSHNVRNYPTFEQGVAATVATMEIRSYYGTITDLLRSGTATKAQISSAVAASPWGTGGFNHYSGDSASTPVGQKTSGGVDNTGADPYSAYPASGSGETLPDGTDGTRSEGTMVGDDDLDALVQATWPNGIPEDVSWNDLPAQLQEEVKKQLGFVTTYLEHPELGSILIRSALEGWSSELTQNYIEATDWWRETDVARREWEGLTITDPGEAERQREGRRAVLRDAASRAGVGLSKEDFEAITEESLRYNWNEAQIIDAIVAHASYDPDNPAPVGDLGTMAQSIQEMAAQYGLTYSDKNAFELSRRMVAGELEEEDLRGVFIEEAKGRFPWMSEQFEKGYTLNQLLDTRANEVARILGVDAQEVDFLNDPKFNPILEYDTEDGMRSMTLQETRRYIGTLPDYQYTDDALQRGSSLARRLLQSFGAI